MRHGYATQFSIRPRGLQRLKAASYIGVGPRTFDQVVKDEGIQKINVPGHRRSIYDVQDLDALIDRWKSGGDQTAA